MSFSRAFQWYHSHLDPIWPDGTFKTAPTKQTNKSAFLRLRRIPYNFRGTCAQKCQPSISFKLNRYSFTRDSLTRKNSRLAMRIAAVMKGGGEGECLLHNPNYAQSFLHHKIPEEGNTTSLFWATTEELLKIFMFSFNKKARPLIWDPKGIL